MNEWKLGLLRISNNKLPDLSSFNEMANNLRGIFDGYFLGYARSLYGFFIYGLMSLIFCWSGNLILCRLTQYGKPTEQEMDGEISLTERLGISFLIGCVSFSLLWLLIGSVHLLKPEIAWFLLISAGIPASLKTFQLLKNENFKMKTLKSWKSFDRLEKILLIFTFFFLSLWALNSILYQTYADALSTHLALPSFFLNNGNVSPYPYNIFSYFHLNLEMLALWGVLLKSDVVIGLIPIGFLIAFAMILFGLMRRRTNATIGLFILFMFLSIPLILHSSMMFKNDLPMAACLFAHYFCLIQAFAKQPISTSRAQLGWVLLSGFLCGGAIGYKFVAILVAPITFLMLMLNGLRGTERKSTDWKILAWWVGGICISSFPWFMRTFIDTGNIIYPFMTEDPLKPWHWRGPSTSFFTKGWPAVWTYLQSIVFKNKESLFSFPPSWGPHFILILSSLILVFHKPTSKILNRLLLAAGLSLLALSLYTFEVRYLIGLIVFLSLVPTGYLTHSILKKDKNHIFNKALLITSFLFFMMMVNLSGS